MPLQESSGPSFTHPPAGPLLQAGRNCWRIERAHRFSMLVDAAAYFAAVRAAIRAARHSVYILSWDIDSRTLLMPEGANDGYPEPLGEFLQAMVARHPDLHIYVLNWDFAMLYALEREWMPVYKPGWRTHGHLSFWMDNRHPMGASHHQKIVVVDDALAFVGGLDLTRSRWDTPAHAHDEPLRHGPDGRAYAPFHDVQAMVDGPAAQALGELARLRWRRATGKPAFDQHDEPDALPARHRQHRPIQHSGGSIDPWPAGVIPDLQHVDVAISRTEPAFEGSRGVHEVRQLHLDVIASARRSLFFENQYFTSGLIANAFAERLAEEDGPEVAIISPQTQSGWLEDATMGVLRARLHRQLKRADQYGRYRLYCPQLPDLQNGCLNVHSKVFAMDDEVFSIGSANLSNRSMALDTECNLTVEASGDEQQKARIRQGIVRLRSRLLGEHLGCQPETVESTSRRGHNLHATIAQLTQGERCLRVMDPVLLPELDAITPERALFDPERPLDPDKLVAELVPKDARKPLPRRLVGASLIAIGLILLAVAWRWTPLREWMNLSALVAFARGLDALPFTSIAVVGSFVLAGLVMVPVTLLIAVTGIVFGPFWGAIYALAGTLLSALVSYALGSWLGRETVRRLLGPRINRLSRRIAKRGIIAMMIVRLLPIAPFTIVNLVAGASHIRLRDYLFGTFLGMLPGILLTVTFVHNLAEAVRNPSAGTLTVLGIVVLLLAGFAVLLQRVFARKGAS